MTKTFNVTGDCKSDLHYMVNISDKLRQIKAMVEAGQYFTINRARQYGKTTTLNALEKFLRPQYYVVSLDFQYQMSTAKFRNENTFSIAFATAFLSALEQINEPFPEKMKMVIGRLKEESVHDRESLELVELFRYLSTICGMADKPIVLIIDEVDNAANNQVFLDFLAQLRGYYLKRDRLPTFQSVILAAVYDIKNIQMKFRFDEEHKINSPWNIAADFDVVMSFSVNEIAGMLYEYEKDNSTKMNIDEIALLLYDYTAGYPYLVSRICKLIDEKVSENALFPTKASAWTHQGFLEAVRILLNEKNTLFESLENKLTDYPQLRRTLYALLFVGETIVYNVFDKAINTALMFGFVSKREGNIVVANRIFEVLLYNFFLTSADAQSTPLFKAASNNKSQFINNGHLDMDTVMKKYVEYFDSIYGDQKAEFDEEEGRRRFLLYIRPIINGTGNYYVEPETRNARRMDVVIDYLGDRFVVELKIWRGTAYHQRGEQQLLDYLDYFSLKKGYMLSYNFNQKKEIGVREIHFGDKVLVEAVV